MWSVQQADKYLARLQSQKTPQSVTTSQILTGQAVPCQHMESLKLRGKMRKIKPNQLKVCHQRAYPHFLDANKQTAMSSEKNMVILLLYISQ